MQRSTGTSVPTPPIGPVLVRLRLIGQMEAWTLTSESILPTGRKTRALLAIVALSAPRPVLRGKLAEMLWSRRPEEQARASLRQEIHRLLDALDPLGAQVLSITRDHLALRPGTVWVDVEELLRASPARPAALALYDGELLEGLDGIDPAFDGWLAGERQRLSDRARSLAELLLREQTDAEMIISSAQQLLRIDRAHEGAWRALMRAYMARGERGMAIQAYERCRLALAEQLDAQPSAETQRLVSDIRNAVPTKPVPVVAETAHALPGRTAVPRLAPRPLPRPAAQPAEETAEVLTALPPRGEPPRPDRPTDRAADAPESGRSPAPRGGPHVGVMPLQMIGLSDAESHLASGLADDLTAALAKFRWTFLVPSTTLARFGAQAASARDDAALRRSMGLDFLVDGSVQRSGNRLRVSLRLLDLFGGNQVIWTQRFDHTADDLLTVQDEVAAQAAAQIDPQLFLAESQRSSAGSAKEVSAYEAILRAVSLIHRLDRASFMQAGDYLRQSLSREPDWAATHAWHAYWHTILAAEGWAADFAATADEAERAADTALALDPQDANALTIAGHVRAFLRRRSREAVLLHDRALAINPNLASAWSLSGAAFAYLGELDEAERRLGHYKKLSPTHPQAFFLDTARVLVPLLRRDHRTAVEIGREVSGMNAAFSAAMKPYLAALGHAGMRGDAALIRARLLALEPGFTIRRYMVQSPLDRESDRDHVAQGLRLAGVPE